MKIHFFNVIDPDGVPFYRADSRKRATELARQFSQIRGAWPLPHMNGAKWPLFTVRKVRA